MGEAPLHIIFASHVFRRWEDEKAQLDVMTFPLQTETMSLTGWGWHTSLSILPRFTASSSSVTLASFSTSASQHAQGKKGTKAPVKRKTKLKKTSTGQKPRRRGGDSGAALSKTNPFLETRKDMSFLEEFLPEVATEQNLYNIFAWSKRTLDAVRFPEGFGLSSSLSRQVCIILMSHYE